MLPVRAPFIALVAFLVRKVFAEVTVAAQVTNEYSMPYESDVPVCICRKPKAPLKDLWPLAKSSG
jgi:hypothetical protein